MRYGHTHDAGRDLLPWLRTVLRNAARAHRRRADRARVIDRVAEPTSGDDPTADVEIADLVTRVKAATWELAPAGHTAFRLCYLDGLSTARSRGG